MINIHDDFLDKKEFAKVSKNILGEWFPWYFNDNGVYPGDGHWQFVHSFYTKNQPSSQFIELTRDLVPENSVLIRIKANCTTKAESPSQLPFHIDCTWLEREYTTSIFYVNTNNGFTVFENGEKIESVANRLITFPSSMKHTGITSTDDRRVLINFNYFE